MVSSLNETLRENFVAFYLNFFSLLWCDKNILNLLLLVEYIFNMVNEYFYMLNEKSNKH